MYIKIISDIISHSIRVLINVRKLGKKYNITNRELGILMQAAALHDIGKILIPKKILFKKEKLTLEDKKIISKHSELSYEILKWALPNEVLFLIKNHHNDIKIWNNGNLP